MEKKYFSFLSVDKKSGIGVAEGLVSKNYGAKVVKEKNVFTIDVVSNNVAKKLNYALEGKLKEDDSTFMRVVFWEGLADRASKVVDKGAIIDVFGKFQVKTYEGQNGTVNYVEIQAKDFKIVKFADKKEGIPAPGPENNEPNKPETSAEPQVDDDGDMPF